MKYIILGLLTVTIAACTKDKYETKPLLEIKSYNDKTIVRDQTLHIDIKYYDKEGDLNGSTFFTRIVRLNKKPVSGPNTKPYTLTYNLPQFTPTTQGEINFSMSFIDLDRGGAENDTLQFKFAVTDRASNTSDTVTSQTVVIVK